MSLFEIKKKLYDKEPKTSENEIKFFPSRFKEKRLDDISERNDFKKTDQWVLPQTGISQENKGKLKWGAIVLGGIVFVILIFFGIAKFGMTAFFYEKVQLEISGPSEAGSGKLVKYEINYKNDNRASLEQATLTVHFPENFHPENMEGFRVKSDIAGVFDLGKIKGRAEGKIIFSGKVYGSKGGLFYIRPELSYKPSNFSSFFSTQDQITTTVSSSPVVLDATYPNNVNNGDEVEYVLNYKNTGEENFSGAKLEAVYPEGFEFLSSEPANSEGNSIWNIGDLPAGADGKIIIKGKISGKSNENKLLSFSLSSLVGGEFFVLSEETANIKIAGSNLYISQTINNQEKIVANAGESLNFSIFYRNDGNVGLRNIIITEKLEGEALDFSTLRMEKGGAYNSGTHTITWKAVNYPEFNNLNPGQSGTVNFSIKVKRILPVKNNNDKNFSFSSLAKIDSPDIPTPISKNKVISSNEMKVKINSPLAISVEGFYNDSDIPNSGPLPPQVDKETTYTIHWKLTNVSNDLESVKVESFLPTWARLIDGANVKYNERTNSIVWDVGNLPSGTGVIIPKKEAIFQIGIKPAVNQVGQSVEILGKSIFSGKDLFTGEELSVSGEGKNIRLLEDANLIKDNLIRVVK